MKFVGLISYLNINYNWDGTEQLAHTLKLMMMSTMMMMTTMTRTIISHKAKHQQGISR